MDCNITIKRFENLVRRGFYIRHLNVDIRFHTKTVMSLD